MLTAAVVTLTGLVALLAVLVVGLLRSHAEILRRLHEVGAGVYDDATAEPGPLPVAMGPRRGAPGRRAPSSLVGNTPHGSAVSIGLDDRDAATLLAFLSTGCTTCAEFWDVLGTDVAGAGRRRVRTVIVTRGGEQESPPEVARLAPADVPIVMSTEAWRSFGVPASPYFVLVDESGAVAGEGTAGSWAQVTGLIDRAGRDGVPA